MTQIKHWLKLSSNVFKYHGWAGGLGAVIGWLIGSAIVWNLNYYSFIGSFLGVFTYHLRKEYIRYKRLKSY